MPAGSVALVQRGTCGFALKALNAQAAGAAAVIVMNEGQPGRTGLLEHDRRRHRTHHPGRLRDVRRRCRSRQRPPAPRSGSRWSSPPRCAPPTTSSPSPRSADDANVVMAGAHLDSVQDGAGINDNGSGSAALLEVAIQIRQGRSRRTPSASPGGAPRSPACSARSTTSPTSRTRRSTDIALYLNFDMIGSPNYMFGVYDGDNSSGTAPPGLHPARLGRDRGRLRGLLRRAVGSPFNDTEFSGRSDYGPFIAVGIPAGGLFTGAEGVEDRGASRGLRRRRGRCIRPVLPPVLRQPAR